MVEENRDRAGFNIFQGHPVFWLVALAGIAWSFWGTILHVHRVLPATQTGSITGYVVYCTALLLFGCLAIFPGCLRQRLVCITLFLSALIWLLYRILRLSPPEAAAFRIAALVTNGMAFVLIMTLAPLRRIRQGSGTDGRS